MNGPSAFYAQHFKLDAPRIDERAFRPFWRIKRQCRLDRMLVAGDIDIRMWSAAIRLRDAARQLFGGVPSYGERKPKGFAQDGALYRMQNRAFVQRVHDQLGPVATALVWSCAIDDSSWAVLGARLRVSPKTAKRWTIAALEALAALQ